MSDQIAPGKRRITVVLGDDQIKRLDALAVERGTSRAALISEAVDVLLDGGAGPSAEAARLDAIESRLDAMKAEHLAQAAAIIDAVRSQPIAVQPPALPDAVSAEECARLVDEARHEERELLDAERSRIRSEAYYDGLARARVANPVQRLLKRF